MNLSTQLPNGLVPAQKVGFMRCDFTTGSLANSWKQIKDDMSTSELHEVQQHVNDIMNQVPSYQWIVELCGGEGLENAENRFAESENFFYWVSFIPIYDSYHFYVYAYRK